MAYMYGCRLFRKWVMACMREEETKAALNHYLSFHRSPPQTPNPKP